MQLITLYTFAEATCFFVALYCLRGEGWNTWGLQRAYLAVVLVTELTGTHLRETAANNLPLYNSFILIECVVVSILLSRFLQPLIKWSIKPWLRGWLGLFGVVWVAEWTTSTAEYVYLNYSVVLMSVAFIFTCGYYFYRLLATTPYRYINRHAPFWWVSGAAIFYFGGLATNLVLDLLIHRPVKVGSLFLHEIISQVLSLALYGLWAYSYIIRYRHPNS